MAKTQKIITTFQFKRGLSTAWTSQNPILADGEPGFELDTGKLKIGRNNQHWNDLEYLNGVANLTALGGLEIMLSDSNSNISLMGFESAELGQVPAKGQNGALTWITPLNESIILNSDTINNWVEGKITAVTNRVYRGEAANYLNGKLYDNNFNEINADINDVYSYNDTKYVWSGEEWIELTGAEIYATKQNLENLAATVQTLADSAITTIATDTTPGGVKSSNEVNKIAVAADGTMSVNTIGVDKLVNNGYTLILNSGQADE